MGRNTIISMTITISEDCEDIQELFEEFIEFLDIDGVDIFDFEEYDNIYRLKKERYNGHNLSKNIKDCLDNEEKNYRKYISVSYGWVDIDNIDEEEL